MTKLKQTLEEVIKETANCFISISYNGKDWYTAIGDTKLRVRGNTYNSLYNNLTKAIIKHRVPREVNTKSKKKGANKPFTFEYDEKTAEGK